MAVSCGRRPRWGLLGTGRIANDFCAALLDTGGDVAACAAREPARATEFVARFGLDGRCRVHSSYQELAADPEVDIVYISTLHPLHLQQVLLCLRQGKHVLCEKPLGMNEAECADMFAEAEKQGRLCLEAMWTRYFPLVQEVQRRLARGDIGEVVSLTAEVGFRRPEEDSRGWDRSLGGGALLWNGVYAVQWACLALGSGRPPSEVKASVQTTEGGVDRQGVVSLAWERGGLASVSWSHVGHMSNEVRIVGSEGFVRIHAMAHCPTTVDVVRCISRTEREVETLREPLPPHSAGSVGLVFPNSEGLQHEVRGVEAILIPLMDGESGVPDAKAATVASEQAPFSPTESLVLAKLCDEIRRQGGFYYGNESEGLPA